MRKVLAVLLSVITLFSALAISASAATVVPAEQTSLIDTLRATGVINSKQVVLCFDLQGGAIYGSVPVYNDATGKFESKEGVTGLYHLVPDNSQYYGGTYASKLHTAGTSVTLPSVVPPEGKVFDGWEYTDERGNTRVYSAASRFVIPEGNYQTYSEKAILYFTAVYSPAPIEGDIFDTILNVLLGLAGKVLALLGFDLPLDELVGGLF